MKSQFTQNYRQLVDPTDPVVFECKRKVRYPTQHMAEKNRVAQQMRSQEVLEVYLCPNCDGFHLGHPMKSARPTAQPVEVITSGDGEAKPRAPKVWLPKKESSMLNHTLIDTTNLAKLVDDFRTFYIFKMPDEMPHTEKNILDYGVLVALKKGEDVYKESTGFKSPIENWKAYSAMPNIYTKNLLEFQRRIRPHLDIWERDITAKEPPLTNPVLKVPIKVEPKTEEPRVKRAYNKRLPVTHIAIPPEVQEEEFQSLPDGDELEWLKKAKAAEVAAPTAPIAPAPAAPIPPTPAPAYLSPADMAFIRDFEAKVADFTVPSGQIRGMAWATCRHIMARVQGYA